MNTLEHALASRGLSVNDASKVSGIRYDTIWKHVQGFRGISPEMALEYEEKLNIPKTELRPDLWPPTPATPASTPAPTPQSVPDAVPHT